MPAGQQQRLAADQALQLAERDHRSGERHRADEHAEEDLGLVDPRFDAVQRPAVIDAPSRCRRAPPPRRRSCAGSRPAAASTSFRRAPRAARRSRRRHERAGQDRVARRPAGRTPSPAPRSPCRACRTRCRARADSCADSPPRLKMKSSPAARYAMVTSVSGIALSAEHLQHALRDEEAAGDVDRRQQDRGGAEDDDRARSAVR